MLTLTSPDGIKKSEVSLCFQAKWNGDILLTWVIQNFCNNTVKNNRYIGY